MWQLSTFSPLQNQTKNKHQFALQKLQFWGVEMCWIFIVSLQMLIFFMHLWFWGEIQPFLSCCVQILCVVVVYRLLNYWLKVAGLRMVVYSNLVRLIVVVAMERWQTSLGVKESWPASLSVGVFAHCAANAETLYESRLKTNTLLWSWSRGLSVGWRLLVEKAVG